MSTPTQTTMSAEDKKTPKTLPMKQKTIQCGIFGFLKKMETDGVIDSTMCETLIGKLPLFDTVEEQVKFYDENMDIKHIEQTYIKPRIQQHKKDMKPKKEKRPRQKKEEVLPEKMDVDVVNTPEMVKKETKEEPEKPTKKPRKKAEGEKKPRGRKAKETEVVFSRDEDDVKKDLSEDLKAESYVESDKKTEEPKPKKKRVTKKKEIEVKPKEETEYWMFMIDGNRYWTTDEHEKNGDVFSYDGKDEDGDPAPGKKIGKLVDGKLVLE